MAVRSEAARASVSAWTRPTRAAAAWFGTRVWAHVLLRTLRNTLDRSLRKHRPGFALADAAVIAESRTPLWTDGAEAEFPLVAGKVHNLRQARRAFDGLFVPAGSPLSFWQQLGRPTRRAGFVEGREVRAGCVVPTIAGGLCQLSNALASCAVAAGFELTERHRHTALVDGGFGGTSGVDATVFWNYLDLRFIAPCDYRIDVDLTAGELVVRFRSATLTCRPGPTIRIEYRRAHGDDPPLARGCLTCDETDCFRHRARPEPARAGRSALLLNAWTPEAAAYLEREAAGADWYRPWVRAARRRGGTWAPPLGARDKTAWWAPLRRSVLLRLCAGDGGTRQAAIMRADRWLAESLGRRLQAHHTHVFVDQSLLVPLWESGELAGRSFDVYVAALPAAEIQRRLDDAHGRRPAAASLGDFRVDASYCALETIALRAARRLITPHAEVARHLEAISAESVERLAWIAPAARTTCPARIPADAPVVVFPASSLARKGAFEMAEAVRLLGWKLIILGSAPSDPALWQGIEPEYLSHRDPRWLARADVVALPAWVEHAPRSLLAALAQRIPIVASRACGLPSNIGVIEVEPGDSQALVQALRRAIEPMALKPATRSPRAPVV